MLAWVHFHLSKTRVLEWRDPHFAIDFLSYCRHSVDLQAAVVGLEIETDMPCNCQVVGMRTCERPEVRAQAFSLSFSTSESRQMVFQSILPYGSRPRVRILPWLDRACLSHRIVGPRGIHPLLTSIHDKIPPSWLGRRPLACWNTICR